MGGHSRPDLDPSNLTLLSTSKFGPTSSSTVASSASSPFLAPPTSSPSQSEEERKRCQRQRLGTWKWAARWRWVEKAAVRLFRATRWRRLREERRLKKGNTYRPAAGGGGQGWDLGSHRRRRRPSFGDGGESETSLSTFCWNLVRSCIIRWWRMLDGASTRNYLMRLEQAWNVEWYICEVVRKECYENNFREVYSRSLTNRNAITHLPPSEELKFPVPLSLTGGPAKCNELWYASWELNNSSN